MKNLVNTEIFGDRRSIIIVSLSVFIVYFNSLFNPFVWDDIYLIVRNPQKALNIKQNCKPAIENLKKIQKQNKDDKKNYIKK
ncbi:hypothetical protein J7K25_05010 [bacterium]|nr:hypothetical protein [bacterium]